MATDVERLVVSLEASITKYERAMQRALGQTNQTARRIEQRFERMSGVANNALGKIAAVYAGAQSLRGASELIDANIRIQNSLKVAGLEGTELTRVYDNLYSSAQRNAAPLEALSTLYGRAAAAQKELGASSEDLAKFTENVAMALRVQGGDASQAQGALLQLGQALGSARVFAEEFNSINEGARPILQAAAAGIEEAGGSVAKLKELVIEGRVSNKAFFDGIQAGAYVLEDKLVGAELTVSQSFIRLRNVLIDVAGDFNEGTNASRFLAGALEVLGDRIKGAADDFASGEAPVLRLLNAIMETSRELGKTTGADNIGKAIERAFDPAGAAVEETNIRLSEAGAGLRDFAAGAAQAGTFSAELQAALEDMIEQLISGQGNAELARQAIQAMGDADPNFDIVRGEVQGLVSVFLMLRDAANAARAAASFNDVGTFPSQEEFNGTLGVKTPTKPKVDLNSPRYAVAGSGGGGAGGGGKSGGQSPSQRFQEALDAQAHRNEQLRQETALQATLNPLVDDYGSAMDRLRIQQDLENDATEAGLALTPDRLAAIAGLADGYAAASVEAAKLAEAQDQARETMQEWFDTGRGVMQGFIDDLIAGKDAADVLSNALSQVGSALINMGMDSLFGGGGGGGFGMIGKLFGFASGTANTGGVRGQPRGIVHGQEAVIPLPAGGRVPVDIRMPTLPTQGAQTSGPMSIHVSIDGANGDQHVIDLVQQGVSAGLKQYDSMMKPRVQGILAQTKQSGPRGLRG